MSGSRAAWREGLPLHWQCLALKRLVSLPIADGPHETPEFLPDGVPFVSAEGVEDGRVHLSRIRGFISRADHAAYAKKCCPRRGDVFVVKSGSTTGKVAYVDFDEEFNVWSPIAVVRNHPARANSRFLFHFLSSAFFQRQVQDSWSFGTQPNIGMRILENLYVAVPPLPAQRAIANFLDKKTKAIDDLIQKKERLIELLAEKRQALITQAVTKGLDPSVPMKDSGVEWLGKVPRHWERLPVSRICSIGRGRVMSAEFMAEHAGPYPVYSSQTQDDGVMGSIDSYMFDGDYLTWTTDGANAGTVFRRRGRFSCTNVCGTLRARSSDLDLTYLNYALGTETRRFVRLDINPKLMNNVMAKIKVLVPPPEEQLAIGQFLAERTTEDDQIVRETERSIVLLREYRQALISAAVTGQIDVAGEAA